MVLNFNMDKYNKIIDLLEKNISRIKNKKDHELSIDALEGHRKRYEDELKIICNNLKNGKILDVGASPYHITFCLKALGYDIQGLDINPQTLGEFQKMNGLIIKKCNIEKEKLPFEKELFDLVIFTEIFEHLGVDPLGVLKEIRRILKLKGLLILSTPNLYTLHKIIMFNLGKSFNNALDEFKKIESTGYMGHIREYSNREIKMILEDCGYKVRKTYFKKYNNYFLEPLIVKKTPLILLGLILELVTNFMVFLRPTQIVIAEKRVHK